MPFALSSKPDYLNLQSEILELLQKLKASDYRFENGHDYIFAGNVKLHAAIRGENAEMNIQRLNVRIDQVMVMVFF